MKMTSEQLRASGLRFVGEPEPEPEPEPVQAPAPVAPAPANVAAPQVSVQAPTVNVAAPNVTVQPPTVNISSPEIHLPAPIVHVQPAEGFKELANALKDKARPTGMAMTVERDFRSGLITSAHFEFKYDK